MESTQNLSSTEQALTSISDIRNFLAETLNWDAPERRRAHTLDLLDQVSDAIERPNEGSKKAARLRRSVYTRDGFQCRDCGRDFDHPEPYRGEPIPGLTLGHIVPKWIGGRRNTGNLIAHCLECNSSLGGQIWLGARNLEVHS